MFPALLQQKGISKALGSAKLPVLPPGTGFSFTFFQVTFPQAPGQQGLGPYPQWPQAFVEKTKVSAGIQPFPGSLVQSLSSSLSLECPVERHG